MVWWQDSSSWFSGELLNDPKGNNSEEELLLLMFSFLKSVANEYKKELAWTLSCLPSNSRHLRQNQSRNSL